MSTSQPCCTQTGCQREARKEWPYFPGFPFFHQTTYFSIGKMFAKVGDGDGGGGGGGVALERYIILLENSTI